MRHLRDTHRRSRTNEKEEVFVGMNAPILFRDLVTKIRIALATNAKVTINCPRPKPLWRALKKELPVCDVTFDEHAVHVAWKMTPEEQFAERVYESGRKRAEQEAFIRNQPEGETDAGEKLVPGRYVSVVLGEGPLR